MENIQKCYRHHLLETVVTLLILVLTSNAALGTEISRDWAAAYNLGGPYFGVDGHIFTWHADVAPNEFSLNLVGCGFTTDNHTGETKSAIFAGWAVHPELFKDGQSRAFVALTNKTDICFYPECPGFVPVSNNTYIGTPLTPSGFGDSSKQYYISVSIYKDLNLDKWWVAFNEENVGYYPFSLTGFLTCNIAIWGGMVQRIGEAPTRTEMGNGHFTNEGLTKSGLITNARVKIFGGQELVEPPTGLIVNWPQCYNFKNYGSIRDPAHVGYAYSYGGPGAWSSYCQ